MHPFLGRRGAFAAYLAAWIPLAVMLAVMFSFASGVPMLVALVLIVPTADVYSFLCLSAWYVCRSQPLRTTPPLRIIASLAVGAVVSAALWVLLVALWGELLAGTGILPAARGTLRPLAPFVFATGALLYVLAVAVHYLVWMYEESRAAEQRALELRVLAREAELRALRAQIDPHFLFNSLNSISALTTANPDGARRMAVRLADFLRATLRFGGEDAVRLADEIVLAEHYLAVEQVRFGPRLAVENAVEGAAAECLVPPLILQPLVENAVRHGIAHLVEGGTIHIEARIERERLRIAVQNPRDPDAGTRSAGIGIENVRRRLATLHGAGAELRVSEGPTSFRVEISLPARAATRPDPAAPRIAPPPAAGAAAPAAEAHATRGPGALVPAAAEGGR